MRVCSQCMNLVKTAAASCPHDGAPANLVSSLPAGTRIGDYTVIRLLGEGGMGSVYEVKHEVIHRRAAMKFLRPEYTQKSDVVARFLQEAKAVNIINHDNIIDIYDYGEGEDGLVYFVMELLEGESFTDLLDKRGRLPLDLTIHIFTQLLQALAAAHEKNIVHRDLKPDNVFLVRRESDPHFVKLLDFGIARMRGEGSSDAITRAGSLLGTPQYMSPEQAMGQAVDARSDIFSLGIMLYRTVVGKLPFSADHLTGLLAAVIQEELPAPRQAAPDAEIPAALERMILRATQKNPAARYASAAEMLSALDSVKAEVGICDYLDTVTGSAPIAMAARRGAFPTAPVTRAGSSPITAHAPGPAPLPTATTVAPARAGISTGLKVGILVVALGAAAAIGAAVMVMSGSDSGARAARDGDDSQTSAMPAASEPAVPAGAIAALVTSGKLAEAQAMARQDLEKSLASDDTGESSAAIQALVLAGTPRAAPLFYRALTASLPIRLAAARALRDLHLVRATAIPDAAPRVREALDSSGHKLRIELAACLVPLGDKDGVALLEGALDGGEPGGQLSAAEALALAGQAGPAERGKTILSRVLAETPPGRERWQRAARGLVALGDPAARQALEGELSRPEPERAVAAAEILARAGDEQAVTYLVRVAGDAGFARRGDAALALARVENQAALGYVTDALASDDAGERTRAMAVAARLASQGGNTHTQAIASMTGDSDRAVRLTARVALLAFP